MPILLIIVFLLAGCEAEIWLPIITSSQNNTSFSGKIGVFFKKESLTEYDFFKPRLTRKLFIFPGPCPLSSESLLSLTSQGIQYILVRLDLCHLHTNLPLLSPHPPPAKKKEKRKKDSFKIPLGFNMPPPNIAPFCMTLYIVKLSKELCMVTPSSCSIRSLWTLSILPSLCFPKLPWKGYVDFITLLKVLAFFKLCFPSS